MKSGIMRTGHQNHSSSQLELSHQTKGTDQRESYKQRSNPTSSDKTCSSKTFAKMSITAQYRTNGTRSTPNRDREVDEQRTRSFYKRFTTIPDTIENIHGALLSSTVIKNMFVLSKGFDYFRQDIITAPRVDCL